MAYRNKTYVAFDGDNDMKYYLLMKAWKQNDNTEFNFYDAHDINNAYDSSMEETIKRKLCERMNNSKVFVLLVGEHTKYLRKFVLWEIEEALGRSIPIIVVNLNGMKERDNRRCPSPLRENLSIHISYNAKIMQYALEHWPDSHYGYLRECKNGTYKYNDSVYSDLGL